MREVYEAINEGAVAFLHAEYEICARFVAFFAILILVLISWGQTFGQGFLTMISFVLGAATSTACGYIGMRVATFSNVRTTINAQKEGASFRRPPLLFFVSTSLRLSVYVSLRQCPSLSFTFPHTVAPTPSPAPSPSPSPHIPSPRISRVF